MQVGCVTAVYHDKQFWMIKGVNILKFVSLINLKFENFCPIRCGLLSEKLYTSIQFVIVLMWHACLQCEVRACLIVVLVLSDVCWLAHSFLGIGRITDDSMPWE